MLEIDLQTARRFILGKQGLWPGRRWRDIGGVEQAMREMEYLQLDPLQIITRSQDIQLHSRVLNYSPGQWEDVTYGRRQFFDWGGWLAVRPMDELPYWRVVMRRERDGNIDCDSRVQRDLIKYTAVIEEMRELLEERGLAGNRDFDMAERTRTEHYRGRKDSSLALYTMWRSGELMTHHRQNFERVYALTEQVAPAHLLYEPGDDEVDRFLIKKEISFAGLSRLPRTSDAFHRGVPFSKKEQLCAALLADGEIVDVKVEEWRAVHYALSSDVTFINDLSAGRLPPSWTPLDTTTTEEAVFLAPLDPVSARGRAKTVFDFDYVWEVYKPRDKRKFGYYTLPVLWGDRFVGRFDSKYDQAAQKFTILGLWLEDDQLGEDDTFAVALARGFARFTTFLGADELDAGAIREPLLRQHI